MSRRNKKNEKILREGGAIHGTRKVVEVGGSLGITLPKEWAEYHDIKKGDELPLVANDMITLVKREARQ